MHDILLHQNLMRGKRNSGMPETARRPGFITRIRSHAEILKIIANVSKTAMTGNRKEAGNQQKLK